MIRLIFCLLLSPLAAYAQSSTVLPSELEISVTVENADVEERNLRPSGARAGQL
jgi:hypothetical protein